MVEGWVSESSQTRVCRPLLASWRTLLAGEESVDERLLPLASGPCYGALQSLCRRGWNLCMLVALVSREKERTGEAQLDTKWL